MLSNFSVIRNQKHVEGPKPIYWAPRIMRHTEYLTSFWVQTKDFSCLLSTCQAFKARLLDQMEVQSTEHLVPRHEAACWWDRCQCLLCPGDWNALLPWMDVEGSAGARRTGQWPVQGSLSNLSCCRPACALATVLQGECALGSPVPGSSQMEKQIKLMALVGVLHGNFNFQWGCVTGEIFSQQKGIKGLLPCDLKIDVGKILWTFYQLMWLLRAMALIVRWIAAGWAWGPGVFSRTVGARPCLCICLWLHHGTCYICLTLLIVCSRYWHGLLRSGELSKVAFSRS